jgi:putative membrane protein
MLRWLLAAVHLLALGIGLGAVWARGRALRQPLDTNGLRRVFAADAWWGVAAILWLVTGLWRWLGGTEKVSAYYLANHVFLGKMALFVAIVLLELSPMMALITWRRQVAAGQLPDVARAGRFARISEIQAGLIVLMVLAATAMARGYGARQ